MDGSFLDLGFQIEQDLRKISRSNICRVNPPVVAPTRSVDA